MALTVETGAIVAGADSYVSIADADAYHAARGHTAWTGTEAAREAALRNAADLLDSSYAWIGVAVSEAQEMRWPRGARSEYAEEATISTVASGTLRDRDGRVIETNEIPRAVIRAQCELALLLLTGSGVGGDAAGGDASGPLRRVKAGGVEVEYAPGVAAKPAADSGLLPNGAGEKIDRILTGLYAAPGATRVRLVKA